jgi:hypothetical protein
MWPFKRKPIIDPDTAEWHADNFAWLVATFGGNGAFANSTLVLPKAGFFLSQGEEGHAKALRLLERVKQYCGMDDWPVELVPDHNPAAIQSSLSLAAPVHGKFRVCDGAVHCSQGTRSNPAYPCLKRHLAKLLKRTLCDLALDGRFINQIRASIPVDEKTGEIS